MKRCPQCNFNYSDDTLEFCLEDGARLFFFNKTQTDTPTITIPDRSQIPTENIVNFSSSNLPETAYFQQANNLQHTPETDSIEKKSFIHNHKIFEISSITVSLIHNWWQWLYLNNQYYSSFSTYILSANFLMWLLLLATGVGVSLYTLKKTESKAFPIISLVILAVNLILILVPKR